MAEHCRGLTIEELYQKTFEQNIPLNVLFELTHRCNLRCRQCYVSPDGDKELSFDEVKHILDQLADSGALFLTFSGGEILLRDDFFDIAAYARSRNFAMRLFTNGMLITESVADKIEALSPVDVGISIYGHNADHHEFVTRIPGSFNASVNALKLLNKRNIATKIKCLLMAHNVKHVEQIVAMAEELGAIAQFDPLVTPRNNGDQEPTLLKVSDEMLMSLMLHDKPEKEIQPENAIACAAGRDMASISPSGCVYPCVQFPVPFGNLRERTFSDIWFNSNEAIKLRALRMSDIQACASCGDFKYCRICLGLNVVETGSWSNPSKFNCWVADIRKQAIEGNSKGGLHETVSL